MIIVNLTTTSTRLDLCGATLWSLINQEKLPDIINVWVSDTSYLSDKGITIEPRWLHQLNSLKHLIHLKYTENTGPYRKLFPVLESCTDDDIIIYADDDVIYGGEWLLSLYQTFISSGEKFVISSRVRKRTKNKLGYYKSYAAYPVIYNEMTLDSDYILTGVGGVLLKKKFISKNFIKDKSFLQICPLTDDLWISTMLIRSGASVKTCPNALKNVLEIQHSNYSLSSRNTGFSKTYKCFGFLFRTFNRALGYFGLLNSNNDLSQKRIDKYFNKKLR